MTKKECPVCVLLNSDSDFRNYINSSLKKGDKISEIILELADSKFSAPSEYYFKKHKIDCLKDFVLPAKFLKTTKKNELIHDKTINEDYKKIDNFTPVEKNQEYKKYLHRIYYKLLKDTVEKDKAYKENISCIKILHDILNYSVINVSSLIDSEIDSSQDLEKLGVNLISLVLENKVLSEDTALNVAKILIKESNMLQILKNPEFQEEVTEDKEIMAKDYMAFVNAKNKN